MSDAPELAMPPLPATWLPFWKAVRVVQRNTLSAWPAEAFERDLIKRRILMRHQVIVNSPDHIRHVMLDNVSNYGRSKVFSRIVEPVVGKGLLLSEGDDWRRQRRAVAPAYTPARGAELAGAVRRHIDFMLDRWGQLEDGVTRNISRDMADVTLGVGAEAIFSETNFKDLVHEMLRHDVNAVGRLASDRKVGAIVGQRRQQAFAIGDLQADAHAGVLFTESRDQRRQKIVRSRHDGDPEQSTLQPAELIHRCIEIDHLDCDSSCVAAQFMTRFGQEQALADLVNQRQPDLLLKLLDLHGNGGLREIQVRRSARDGAMLRDGFENTQLAKRNVNGVPSPI